MKNHYRVVEDDFAGYEVQIKRWWFPFWMQIGSNFSSFINTNITIEEAKKLIEWHKNGRKKKVFYNE